MLETEYDEKKTMELFRKEGWTEGHTEGRQEGLAEGRQEGLAEGRQEGLAEGILNTIAAYREFHLDNDAITQRIMEKFSLSEETAKEYLTKSSV